MNFTSAQYSFAGGVTSPELYGRADLEKHATCVADATNFIARTQGGLYKRPGTLFLALRKYQDKKVGMGKFVFSSREKYALEFGDGYIRFATAQGYIQKNGRPYEIPSPYREKDLPYITLAQSADVVYLGVKGFPPKTLTRYAQTDWRLEDYPNKNGPFEIDKGDRALLTAGENGQLLMTQLTGVQFTKENEGDYFKLERDFEARSVSFTQNGSATAQQLLEKGFLCCGSWQLDTTGTWTGTIKLEYSTDGENWKTYRSYSSENNANVNSSGEISDEIKLLRLNCQDWSSGTAYIQFRVNLFTYNLFGKITAVKDAVSAEVQLTNFPAGAYAQLAGELAYQNYTLPVMTENAQPEGEAFFNQPGFTGDVNYEDGSVCTTHDIAYKALDADESTAANVPAFAYGQGPRLGYKFADKKLITSITLQLQRPAQDMTLEAYVYNETTGWKQAGTVQMAKEDVKTVYQLEFQPAATEAFAVSFRRNGEVADDDPLQTYVSVRALTANAKTITRVGTECKYLAPAWNKKTGYPSVACLFQSRAGWFDGHRGNFTRIDDLNNFEVKLKVTDEDGISANVMDSGLNTVVAAIPMQRLVILTDGGEFVTSSAAFTPSASGFVKQSNYGAAPVRPVVVGNRVIFVQLMGGRLLDLQYDYATDNWQAEDLCALAPHLFVGKQIVRMDYQSAPQGIIWTVLSDGTLLALSYERQHSLLAWTPIETDGQVEDVCVLPAEWENDVLLAVNRGGVRTLERLACQHEDKEPYFVDAGTVTTGNKISRIDGLAHLEGRKVCVLADREIYRDLTVTDGAVMLPKPCKRAAAGLAYAARLVTLPMQPQTQQGPFLEPLNVTRLLVGLKNSYGGKAGLAGGRLDEMIYGEDGAFFTGEADLSVDGISARGPQICIMQDDPLPFNVTKLTAQYT